MKKSYERLGILLCGVTGIALLAAMALRLLFPRIILPRLDAPTLILLSLVALVLDHYLPGDKRRDYRLIPLYGALIFGIFPLATCLLSPIDALKTALIGAVVLTAAAFLFDAMTDRLASGPVAKVAPLISACGLYLAAQCLMGIV